MPKLQSLHKIFDAEVRAKNIEAAKRHMKGVYWRMAGREMPDPVFILGCSRSGTTVTFETITAAPQLMSFGYELPQFWNSLVGPHTNNWASEAADENDAGAEHRQRVFEYIYQHLGEGRLADKTCINVMRGRYLYELFPNAKFVFIQRDGRDNVSSMMDGWRQDAHFGLTQFLGTSPEPVSINDGEFSEWSFFLPPGWRDYNKASLEEVCAYQWIQANQLALEAKEAIPDSQWIHMRYEDIFSRPVEMFEEVFQRLDVPFTEALRERCATLNKRPTSIVKGAPTQQKWKKNNPEAIPRIIEMIRPMQEKLGYDCEL